MLLMWLLRLQNRSSSDNLLLQLDWLGSVGTTGVGAVGDGTAHLRRRRQYHGAALTHLSALSQGGALSRRSRGIDHWSAFDDI